MNDDKDSNELILFRNSELLVLYEYTEAHFIAEN